MYVQANSFRVFRDGLPGRSATLLVIPTLPQEGAVDCFNWMACKKAVEFQLFVRCDSTVFLQLKC